VVDFVEAGFDVRLENPPVIDGFAGEQMDLGYSVLRSPVRANPYERTV
jgi:hypothetical protein